MSSLDTLISQSSPSGGKVVGPSTGPTPAPSYGPTTNLDSLLKASAPSPVAKANPLTPVIKPTVAPAPVPVIPPTPVAKPSVLSNVSTKVANAIDRPDPSTLGTDVTKNTLKYLPSAIVESLPFGLGAAFKQIHDMEEQDPETAQYIDNSAKGLLSKVPGAALDQAKGFIKAPIQGATDVAGLIKAPFAKGNGGIKFNIPGLGEVSNAQYKTAARVANGEDPVQVALEEGSGSILDTLFFASLASKPFQGRPTTTASTEIPASRYNIPEDVIDANGPKSFRLYEPKTSAQLLPPEFIDKVQQNGANLGENFDPKLPTYFKMTFDPANGGTFRGDVVQIRPSYFNTIKNYFGTTSDPSYQYVVKDIGNSGHDLDRAIEAGDMPVDKVYADSSGKLQPAYAEHVVSDLAGKLDQYKPGIGAEFKKTVDLTNPTPTSLDAQAKAFLDKNVLGRGDINTIPVPTPAQIAAAPAKDVTVVNSKVVKGPAIQNAINTTPALKGKSPTIPLDLDNLINNSKTSSAGADNAPAVHPLDTLAVQSKTPAPNASNAPAPVATPESVAIPSSKPALPIASNVSRETIPAELQPLADNAIKLGLSKADFLAQFEAGLNDQNLTKRETVQNISKILTQNGFTPASFYDKVSSGPSAGEAVSPAKPALPTKKKKTTDLDALQRANPVLFRRAQKAENVEQFIDAVVTGDKTTRANVSVPVLTEFFNKVAEGKAALSEEIRNSIPKGEKPLRKDFATEAEYQKAFKEHVAPMEAVIKKLEKTKEKSFSEVQKEANESTEKAMTKGTENKYWREVIKPKLDKGEAVVVGADDLKDYFDKDYDLKNHARYSKAANELFKRAVDESPSDTVKFTVGGTGSGKSDFLVPDAKANFNGVIYDSTGYKYEEGLKNQIDYAESKGKKVEIYAVIPDLAKSRAYTHLREARGEHPVTEAAFIRTHVGAIETMIKAIKDGQNVYVLDTRGDFTPEDIANDKVQFIHNPLAMLEKLEYNETHVKESIKNITAESSKEIVSGRKGGVENLPKENGPAKSQVEIPSVSHIKTPEPLPTKESSITLKAELIPGVSEFVKQDVIPAAKGTAEGVKAVYDQLATLFNPVGRAPTEGTDIIMKHKGTFEKEIFRMEQATKDIKKMWDKQPEPARFDFMSKVEGGAPAPKGFEALADMYRKRLDNAHVAISKYKDVPFIENFFPHFWEKPESITSKEIAKMMAKRPFQGTRSFLKQRVFATIKDGVDLGYKPVSTNPEELVQLYEANVKKFIMAQEIKADMIEKGLWKFVRSGASAPEDFARIDDNIARVYFPQELPGGKTTVVPSGEYWAQKDIARMLNNYLSKDRIMDTALGKGLMNFKNTLNAFQLGFSAFHFTMETIDSIVQKASIGLSQIAQGKVLRGLGNIITSPTAPVQYFKDGQKFYNGDPTLAKIEDALFTGGASLRARQYYKNTTLDTFFKNIREGNYIGALIRGPMAAVEATMRPLFSYYIPRLKVGAFRQLYSEELLRNAKRIADGTLTQEKVARDVWNNIENRMGELNYDNLFWHRNLKAGMMLSFRAVGWNLGTVREIGGGLLQDPFEQFKSKQGREDFKKYGYNFTPKMQYTLALFTMMATFGAIYQYLHTGKKPQGIKDLFYPRNGTKTASGDDGRVEFPSYLKDLYQVSHSPIKTVGNKLAPELSALIDVITNKDYYGDYIRNPNDNLSKQAKQLATFLGTQFLPFTVQNIQQQMKGKSGIEQNIESFLGIINAPSDVVKSEYEKQLLNLYLEQRGESGPKTPEQKAIQDAKTSAREAIQKGDYSELQDLVNKGIITPRGMRTFIINAQKTSAGRMYTQLSGSRKAQLPPAK